MSQSPLDYSRLINAIHQGDKAAADTLAHSLLKRVVVYLHVNMNASEDIAEECAHQAFLAVFEKIRENRIKDPKAILKYLVNASKNEYYRFIKQERKTDRAALEDERLFQQDPDQLQNLIDEERQERLETCLEKLSNTNKEFIMHFFSSKSVELRQAGQIFGFSYAKTRTLKTRIMKQLQECVQKYK